ncbi:MAG: hypothetical protein MMC23_005101 [Stictis urceolatum]|nr:hypothetical protein [Stictis urceolata]
MDGKHHVEAETITEMTEKLKQLSVEENTPLPTRVLDIGDGVQSDEIRLLETSRRSGTYAALSHCWGRSKHVITTQATLAEWRKVIIFEQLPKTFQDAVVITRRLGLRYLWIDSLCIIQDDRTQWEYESALMGEVYRNAYFTIVAAYSVNGDGECLQNRSRSSADAIKLPFRSSEGDSAGSWYVHRLKGTYSLGV